MKKLTSEWLTSDASGSTLAPPLFCKLDHTAHYTMRRSMHAHSLSSGFRLPPAYCQLWNFWERSSTAVSLLQISFFVALSHFCYCWNGKKRVNSVQPASPANDMPVPQPVESPAAQANQQKRKSDCDVPGEQEDQRVGRMSSLFCRKQGTWKAVLVFRRLYAWNPGSWFLIRSDSFEKNCKLKKHCQEKFGVSLESLTSD